MARGDTKIVEEAKKRFTRCEEWESHFRRNFRHDIRFAEGDSVNGWQWEDAQRKARTGADKPALTINKVRQHNLQIVNDARQNKPQVRVQPVGDGATTEGAKVFEGVVRHIEYISDAQTAYDSASYTQVYGGIGYLRLRTGYLRPDSGFDQEIFIERVHDPLTVYLDPDIERFDGSDARFGFVFKDLPRELYEQKYPDAKDVGGSSALGSDDDWHGEDHVRVAEYFRRVDKADTLFAVPPGLLPEYPTGDEVKKSDLDPEIAALLAEYDTPSRPITTPVIEWYKIAGSKIIERNIWAGSYIPVARVVGEETIIDGKLDRKGHTRALIDPQRMYNYWSSAAVETGALQTKVPYIADVESIEGFEDIWASANTTNYGYLPYKSKNDAGQPLSPPQRVEPATQPTACLAGMQTAANELMLASGQYQAEMGAPSNERSGVAINARQRQADNSTYHYVDHLAQAIRFIGRQLIDLIPKVYDTKRILRILAEDGTESHIQLDPQAPQAHQESQQQPGQDADVAAIFNPNVGRYDVIADIGPAFATRRQEAFNAYQQIIAGNPDLVKVAGDLMFKNADFPGADDIAERLRRGVPPQLLGEDQPDPKVQALQQQLGQMHQALGNATTQLQEKQTEAAREQQRIALDWYRAETDRMKAIGTVDPAAFQPVIRELVSQALGQPIVPFMAQHAAAEQAMQPPDPNAGPDPAQGTASVRELSA